jgi:hypothetical protein
MDIYQQILDDTFETVLGTLKLRLLSDTFSLETVRNELDSLYKYEGLDWVGRGEVKRAEIEGTILAYQVFINEQVKET